MSSEGTSSRSDRIHICATKHDVYKQLTEGESSPFKTMKDLFLAAAAIGVSKGDRRPLEKKVTGGIFAWSVFTAQEDVPLLHALVISLGEPLEVLLDQRKTLDILEEYANGGISDLANDLLPAVNRPLVLANKTLSESYMEATTPNE